MEFRTPLRREEEYSGQEVCYRFKATQREMQENQPLHRKRGAKSPETPWHRGCQHYRHVQRLRSSAYIGGRSTLICLHNP